MVVSKYKNFIVNNIFELILFTFFILYFSLWINFNFPTINLNNDDLERAIELLANNPGQTAILKELGQSNNMDIVIKDGRYGIYVTNGKVNVTLPKGMDYNTLDLNTAIDLISKKKKKKRFYKR